MIPRSGGDYAYIEVAFGPLPAFLYLWVALLILVPTGNAITALTFAQYLLKPFWPTCDAPTEAIQILAALITCEWIKVTNSWALYQSPLSSRLLCRSPYCNKLLQCQMGGQSYGHLHGHQNSCPAGHCGCWHLVLLRRR